MLNIFKGFDSLIRDKFSLLFLRYIVSCPPSFGLVMAVNILVFISKKYPLLTPSPRGTPRDFSNIS